ncbi:hypothetical protein RM844_12715 [Streptomyces sp. DSM 44915]|uniref:Transmembrane protein n=1 Tax=Streptomyces chisholmiae TaxID=3075540 RepID=A0ABU2JQ83_9ACTN|nr:hypothetical protein [Streptomyces sp. DSM 44915]MDT0267151.1 hypothetical protein [Streptomyces sp. DSM 44915]
MNSPAELPAGDRDEVERLLDEALRAARLSTGAEPARLARLRAVLLGALPEILATAEPEYRRLCALRERLRAAQAEPGPPPAAAGAPGRAGSGALLVAFALVPVLSGVSALIFLLLGYALRLADPEPAVAGSMRSVGWAFALLAAGGALVAAGALVVAAARNGATSIRAAAPAPGAALADEVAEARARWRRALLDRGLQPLLRRELADAPPPAGRTPRLHYTSPHFSSPGFSRHTDDRGTAGRPLDHHRELPEPGLAAPDFTGPDVTGPAGDGADR